MRQLFVLSIDGMPFTLLKALCDSGDLPNLAALVRRCDFRQMDSVHPCVSAAAWTSFITGKPPVRHGIFGFIERAPGSYDVTICSSRSIAAKNIWQILSDAGRRVFGMNVPITYPPMEVNGTLISDFLCPSLDKVAIDPAVRSYLKSMDYRIDSDPALARSSTDAFLADLDVTMEKRAEAILHYVVEEPWAYFHAHVMETDRLFHFLYGRFSSGDAACVPAFLRMLRKVDDLVGRFVAAIPAEAGLVLLSDHGFSPVKQEVQLARYLVEKGWTFPAGDKPRHPLDILPGRSGAYTLIPGRIYLNLRGREPGGIVEPRHYESTRAEVEYDLMSLKAPDGEPVIDRVICSDGPSGRGPDLIAVPSDGYDLKMGLGAPSVFRKTELEGMHTFSDAMILSRGVKLPDGRFPIWRVARSLFEALDVTPPDDIE